MAVTPNTDVYLLKCPLELDNANQINFANATAQYNYFASLPKIEAENFTYQRKDSIIRFPAHIDNLLEYNYVMYRNTSYGSKWFYAYITDMTYINDNMTAVTIKTDVWQTWCFGLSFKKSFVEREHVSNDAIGAHTVPENIQYGDYICNAEYTYSAGSGTDGDITNPKVYVCMQTTHDFGVSTTNEKIYNGVYQGAYVYAFKYNLSGLQDIQTVLMNLDALGKGDTVVSLFLVPADIATWHAETIPLRDSGGNQTGTVGAYTPTASWNCKLMHLVSLPINTTINGYTPHNKKLFVAPYNYIQVSNHVGQASEFNYEDFTTPSNPQFNVFGAFTQGCSYITTPMDYKKVGSTGIWNFTDYAVVGAKFPQLSWLSDFYLNWQAQNGVNLAVQATQSAIQFGLSTASIATGRNTEASFSINNLLEDVTNIALQDRQAKLVPDNLKGNVSAGDVIFSMNQYGFTYRKMSIKAEYARLIDNYFDMFGYKVNESKIPQYTSRSNWNYIRTKGIAIEATMPQRDLQEIKDMFNAGVTMWHNPATFLDYSQSNNIV